MPFNSVEYHSNITKFIQYISTGNVMADFDWQSRQYGRILVQKSTKMPLDVVIVGRVHEHRFNCGPSGTCLNLDVAGLERAKQQFHIGKPFEEPFAEDFTKAINILQKLQITTAKTNDKRDLLVKDYNEILIRCMHHLFEKREHPLEKPKGFNVYLEDVEDPTAKKKLKAIDEVDEETATWPIPVQLKDELNRIKYTHIVNPLPVYKDDIFVPPTEVEQALKGALIEVTLNIEHFPIFKRDVPPHDTFVGDILQVNILKSADPILPNIYKTRNVHEGPIKLQLKRNADEEQEEHSAKKARIEEKEGDEEE